MQRRVYGVVFLGIGCVAVLVGWCLRHDLDWAFADPHPAIDVDRHVWLGEQELQTTLEPVITIRNRGRQPLVLPGDRAGGAAG